MCEGYYEKVGEGTDEEEKEEKEKRIDDNDDDENYNDVEDEDDQRVEREGKAWGVIACLAPRPFVCLSVKA
ncbi:hypothetical protein Pcinc_030812 [Petrolisthes cinctipes]|uniref:Uncharacterized protein n=1 Tax=Petrolisthes cinctipes TaxID=88211 RepID=A0AAE1EXD6_PETCI|nr:hypothetical protein Pcinc_030812 [Petrolisthes cinctipes]